MENTSTSKTLSTMLRRLAKDRPFLTVLILAPVFWTGLYTSGMSLSGPEWLLQNPWQFAQLALLYPFIEELVFRGLVQERLWRTPIQRLSIYCISMPNVVTSLFFTALHFVNHPPVWALAVFIPSLVFGFFRDRYGHVLPAIILHVVYNTGYFFLFGK